MADAPSLADRLARLIERGGPIPLSLYMAYANAHYYATRDPFGVAGDFVTAPEISQMFGEMIGLWAADLWLRAAPDTPPAWVELGPGRGTLSADALRAMAQFGLTPDVHLVETSPVLRDMQAAAIPGAHFHDDVSTLPADRPLIIIANEFFDALPVRQLVRTAAGWRERLVGWADGRFSPMTGAAPMDAAVPAQLRGLADGAVLESSPASVAIAGALARTIATQGGAVLAIDYGHVKSAPGDSVQALSRHAFADPFADPGERDITAHVDFQALGAAASAGGATLGGPVSQGAFLSALGLSARAVALAAQHPARAAAIAAERERLTGEAQMGELFKVLAFHAPHWPRPEGFGMVAA